MTTALYRRYRPEAFADVIGQTHVTEPLMAALRADRVTHAYLFSGPRGCGKTTSARILARCLNCAQGPTDTPCGQCDSCRELARDGAGSLDVVEIDAASHNGVDDARELRERAAFAPVRDRYKIFILDEAHMVTPQGFNALLKLVEEPPEHVKFIFATTEPEKVIGTIRSRTHHYPFRLVPPDELTAFLEELAAREGVAIAPGVLPLVVRAGGGSVRDSLSVLDQLIAGAVDGGLDYQRAVALLGYTDEAMLDSMVTALAADDGAGVFRVVERVIGAGQEPRRFVEDLLQRLRDLLVVAVTGENARHALAGLPDDVFTRMVEQARSLGPAALSRAADLTNAALTSMTGATSPRLHVELLCARILLALGEVAGVTPAAGTASAVTRPAVTRPDPAQASRAPGERPGRPAATRPAPVAAPVQSAPQPELPSRSAADVLAAAAADWGEDDGPAGPPVPETAPGGPAPARTASRPPAAARRLEEAEARQTAAAPAPTGDRAPSAAPAHPAAAAAPRPEAGAPARPEAATAPARVAAPEARPTASALPAAAPGPEVSAPARPEAATAPARPQPSKASSSAAHAEMVRDRWDEVLQALRRTSQVVWALVSANAHPGPIEADRFAVHIPTAGLVSTFEARNMGGAVAAALRETLGLELTVVAVQAGPPSQARPAQSAPRGQREGEVKGDPKAPAAEAAPIAPPEQDPDFGPEPDFGYDLPPGRGDNFPQPQVAVRPAPGPRAEAPADSAATAATAAHAADNARPASSPQSVPSSALSGNQGSQPPALSGSQGSQPPALSGSQESLPPTPPARRESQPPTPPARRESQPPAAPTSARGAAVWDDVEWPEVAAIPCEPQWESPAVDQELAAPASAGEASTAPSSVAGEARPTSPPAAPTAPAPRPAAPTAPAPRPAAPAVAAQHPAAPPAAPAAPPQSSTPGAPLQPTTPPLAAPAAEPGAPAAPAHPTPAPEPPPVVDAPPRPAHATVHDIRSGRQLRHLSAPDYEPLPPEPEDPYGPEDPYAPVGPASAGRAANLTFQDGEDEISYDDPGADTTTEAGVHVLLRVLGGRVLEERTGADAQ
ncbi:DNA polymerase III subunit gamma and tau [Buchananella hordeovulneris]|uniref:DNA polymerase III subunit gamma and tau n=1 Tax=Buchananella hordeovulneris TaxID=52770 RepID=UPI000F5EBFE9|nr:DNA polymerase III subunit gamma and tau [Buchananella hordeovulneris]RRD42064.1 DNA polymerase III subunit gamma and tau [Buchananella hordeovulneris]